MAREKDIRFTQKKVDEFWKKSVTEQSSRKAAPKGRAPFGAGPPGRESAPAQQARSEPPEKEPTEPFEQKVEEECLEGLSFPMFVSSLAAQGLIQLGDLENPVTRKKEPNLSAAKETIELLLMLKEKTRGNLTGDESRLLETVIADLQVRYVELSG